jgi:hypothetical protein
MSRDDDSQPSFDGSTAKEQRDAARRRWFAEQRRKISLPVESEESRQEW